ncbi:MAG: sigma-70 family RNA polymerase sigma factor [Pseudomonadota bacterium]
MDKQHDITMLLQEWKGGQTDALEKLTPIVYDELKKIARNSFRGERANHTLQPTAIVHEAFANLAGAKVDWQNRTHFFALSARMMRRILITHAKARRAQKRGGDATAVTLHESMVGASAPGIDVLDLDMAISKLAEQDSRKAELIEMNVFSGLTYAEMAEVTGLSTSTLDRELRFAKAWLKATLDPDTSSS